MKRKLEGVLPPIPTPFADDALDLSALGVNIDRWIATGLHGIVVLGSNGEAPFLSDEESDLVVSVAREHVPHDRWLIAGSGRESTRATIESTRRAASLGADAVLVRTPAFYKSQMTPDAFVRHYVAIADCSPVPIILYNFPAVTGVNLGPSTVARLVPHPNILGIKESSSDLAQLAGYVEANPDLAVMAGSAPVFYASLCLGAAGGILAVAAVIPELCLRLYTLVDEGRHGEARQLQRAITPLAQLVTSVFGVSGLKAALDLAGYVGGSPRSPLGMVPPEGWQGIQEQLKSLACCG